MMGKPLFLSLLLCLHVSAIHAAAHPGWGLVRDPARGVIYYTDLQRVWRIDANGERSVAVPDVHTHELRLDEAGNLYGEDLADGPDLKRVTASGVELVAAGLSRAGGRFAIMGLHAASDGSIYAAAFEDRAVVRLAPDGTRSVAARSDAPWQPSAVLVAPDGLWVMEYDAARVQLRRIGSDGRIRVY